MFEFQEIHCKKNAEKKEYDVWSRMKKKMRRRRPRRKTRREE